MPKCLVLLQVILQGHPISVHLLGYKECSFTARLSVKQPPKEWEEAKTASYDPIHATT